MSNALQLAALDHAANGWPVFPCNPDTKGPLTEHGFKDASTDPKVIAAWWVKWPRAMIAVPTGEAIGAWVLDIDDPTEFEANCKILLPATLRGDTGKGYHLYFRWDPAKPMTNVSKTVKGWGIPELPGADVRGQGGYVIIPPSIHPTGRSYAWANENVVEEAPSKLVEMIQNRKSASSRQVAAARPSRDRIVPGLRTAPQDTDSAYGLAALKKECEAIGAAGPGAQEQTLNSAALKIGSLVGGGELSPRTARVELVAAGMSMQSFDPGNPWSAELIGSKISRGLSDGAADPRAAPRLQIVTSPATSDVSSRSDRNPRLIQVRDGDLHNIASQAEAALCDAGAPFFIRNGIVKPIVDEVPTFGNRMTKVARLKSIDIDAMIDHLSRSAVFTKFNQRKQAEVRTDPPRQVAATILSRDGEWLFPRLAGVITTPTLRPDGTILSKPGYDQATHLLLLDPPALPPMPDSPLRDDAAAALEMLDALLDEFPFVDEASRSVALSALITPVVRGSLMTAPMHVTTAPAPGSGKSYIIDLAAGIAIGNRAPVLSAGKNEEETEKRLGGALLKGQPLISIDNVNGGLGGDLLCQAIERPIVDLRPLGGSVIISIDNRACMFATGNNINVVGDMTRRVIISSLDPNMERPETRQFKIKPFDMIMQNRGDYIAAALTVVRAYVLAGCPGELPALASFEDWSRLVRSSLVWLGKVDPLETMSKARQDDPVLKDLGGILNTWYEADNTRGFTTGELKKLVDTLDTYGGIIHANLRAALREVAPDPRSESIDTRALGHYLGRHKGRVVDGLKLIDGEDSHAKQKVWRVVRL